MAAIIVHDLDEKVVAQLKVRAAQHGRSLETEVRAIVTAVVLSEDPDDYPNLAQTIHEGFAGTGGDDLEVPARLDMPRSADVPE